jgi:hypothetical protein
MTERKFIFFNPTYGYHEEQDTLSDTMTLFGLTMGGNIAMATHKITGLGNPDNPQDAVTKQYLDNAVSGLTWRAPALVLNMVSDAVPTPSGAPPATPTKGDCYVVNTWGVGYTDGDIVEWSGTAWTIVQVNTAGEPANGTRVIVKASGATGSFSAKANQIATYNATLNTWSFEVPTDGWAALINGDAGMWADTAWTYNNTTWVQFSGAGQINAGPGLYKDGNLIGVGAGDGIAIASDAISLALGTDPGLQLTGTSPTKVVSVLAAPLGGLQVVAAGVSVKIDDTPDTLDVDGDGLRVVGLPSLFKINDSAVSANVTATNLGTLTAGSSSNADALHTHSVTAVDEAKRVEDTHLNTEVVATGKVVRWAGTNNEIAVADNDTAPHGRAIGVARTGGAANPGTSEVVKSGVCTGCLTGATVGEPYYLGTTGALVTYANVPKPGQVIRVGYAKNATDLDVAIADYGRKLA